MDEEDGGEIFSGRGRIVGLDLGRVCLGRRPSISLPLPLARKVDGWLVLSKLLERDDS